MHPLLRAAADRQLGLFTAADARRAGYGHTEIKGLCSSGTWLRLRRGVYVEAARLPTSTTDAVRHRADCLAVMLGLGRPTAAISHVSAARLWGLTVRRGLPTTVRLTDPHQWRRGPDYRMAQAALPLQDVVARGPLRLTSVGRTLVDCAREWDLEDTVVAMDAALLARRLEPAGLSAAAERARGRPGAQRVLRAAALADGRAESPLETRGRLRIIGSGLPTPELQVEIRSAGRLVGVVDAWFEAAAVAVEFDGKVKYTDPWRDPGRVLWEEKRREDELRALDIRVVRVIDADVDARWAAVAQRLRGLLASPGPAHRRFSATPRDRGRQHAA